MQIIGIVREDGFVTALGHRVALHLGGEPELKRRVLATLAQLDAPPDEIRFERHVGLDDPVTLADSAPTLESIAPPEPPESPEAESAPTPRKSKGRR